MGNNTRINYQTYMEYSTHVNKYSIMNIGNRIKQIPIKGMRDSIWTETSKLVDDDPWNFGRHMTITPIRRLVIASNDLIILL